MDTINKVKINLKLFILFSIIFYGVLMTYCNNSNFAKAEQIAEELKTTYCKDFGIYDIRAVKRFGEIVVAVSCISKADHIRIKQTISGRYKQQFYFSSPIWTIGGLTPENAKLFETMLQDSRYTHYGTNENKILEEFQNKIIVEDERKWEMWTVLQKKEWIKEYILKTRKRIPGFANCGDKFLD
jgi:hypothetical protein